MSKITYVLALVILCSTLSYGQQIAFYKNSNYQADILHQSLNKAGDSLILESKTTQILKIEIFSDDYSERLVVDSNKTKVDLKILPLGNFVIQAKLGQKWIVMYLEKKEDFIITSSHLKEKNKHLKTASSQQKSSITDDQSIASNDKSSTIKEKSDTFYY